MGLVLQLGCKRIVLRHANRLSSLRDLRNAPLLPEEGAKTPESAVLNDDVQFAPENYFGAGAEQIGDVYM